MNVFAIAALGAILFLGGKQVVHGAKKVGHAVKVAAVKVKDRL